MTVREELQQELQLMIQKADRSISAARRHIEAGDYDFASSRAYYAAFYAMQAALLTKDLSPAKHAGVIRSFNQHFIKTGIFPVEFSKFISRLLRARQTGDYMFDLSINEDQARFDVQLAENVLEAIGDYLRHEGFISS